MRTWQFACAQFAARATAARIALAWVLGRPAVTAAIVGATRMGHLDDAVAAAELRLSADETRRLDAPYRPREPYGYD
ncbi:aldo/keto reductase [Plantactinospora siamensis]|uniref:Aldo/keto reductase n=1 Tax=Plantactinospora siamensis TaxID=555372 RepID=A0ABV6P2E7_9ACTN